MAEIGTGTTGLTTSIQNYQTPSKDPSDSLLEIAQGLITIQNQLDSLAATVLQNRRGLDLLTAEKGGLCLFLEESCCFYANQSDIVQGAAKKPYRSSLRNPPEIKQLLAVMVNRLELDALGFTLLGPFIFIILLLTFGPSFPGIPPRPNLSHFPRPSQDYSFA